MIALLIFACYWPLQFPSSILTERNATGHVVRADGVQTHMIEALSRMLNFTLVNCRGKW